jgi:hypothetical protein
MKPERFEQVSVELGELLAFYFLLENLHGKFAYTGICIIFGVRMGSFGILKSKRWIGFLNLDRI